MLAIHSNKPGTVKSVSALPKPPLVIQTQAILEFILIEIPRRNDFENNLYMTYDYILPLSLSRPAGYCLRSKMFFFFLSHTSQCSGAISGSELLDQSLLVVQYVVLSIIWSLGLEDNIGIKAFALLLTPVQSLVIYVFPYPLGTTPKHYPLWPSLYSPLTAPPPKKFRASEGHFSLMYSQVTYIGMRRWKKFRVHASYVPSPDFIPATGDFMSISRQSSRGY